LWQEAERSLLAFLGHVGDQAILSNFAQICAAVRESFLTLNASNVAPVTSEQFVTLDPPEIPAAPSHNEIVGHFSVSRFGLLGIEIAPKRHAETVSCDKHDLRTPAMHKHQSSRLEFNIVQIFA
jgi:hypothetical protein